MTNTTLVAKLIELGGNEWKNYGKHRIYLGDVICSLMGIECSKYKSGSIRSASKDGETISNASASRYLTAVEYYDVIDDTFVSQVGISKKNEYKEVLGVLEALRNEMEA